ncbi:hypothetical protein B0H14DRAFT_2605876 [Mycena olivaceomarginata]|nr:hypothetical protein B0H14DRAFT_2605876 [Mycena olivaceomarginata]
MALQSVGVARATTHHSTQICVREVGERISTSGGAKRVDRHEYFGRDFVGQSQDRVFVRVEALLQCRLFSSQFKNEVFNFPRYEHDPPQAAQRSNENQVRIEVEESETK